MLDAPTTRYSICTAQALQILLVFHIVEGPARLSRPSYLCSSCRPECRTATLRYLLRLECDAETRKISLPHQSRGASSGQSMQTYSTSLQRVNRRTPNVPFSSRVLPRKSILKPPRPLLPIPFLKQRDITPLPQDALSNANYHHLADFHHHRRHVVVAATNGSLFSPRCSN